MGFNLLHYHILTKDEVDSKYGGKDFDFKFPFFGKLFSVLEKLENRKLPIEYRDFWLKESIEYPYSERHEYVIPRTEKGYYQLNQWLQRGGNCLRIHLIKNINEFTLTKNQHIFDEVRNLKASETYLFGGKKAIVKNTDIDYWFSVKEIGIRPYNLIERIGNLRKPISDMGNYRRRFEKQSPIIIPTQELIREYKTLLIYDYQVGRFQRDFVDKFIGGKSIFYNSF